METLKQFGDKHVSMDTHGQQYKTTIYNINFELGHTTSLSTTTGQFPHNGLEVRRAETTTSASQLQ
jgi:hypothetical protein